MCLISIMRGSTLSQTKHDALFKKYKRYLMTADNMPAKTVYTMGPLTLNFAVGAQGGIKGGHFIQVFGKSGTGKSTLVLDGIRQWLERDKENYALYVNMERSFDADYAIRLGVDSQRCYVVNPDYTELALDIVEQALNEGIKYIVIDSVAAGQPKAEEDKRNEENAKMAGNALLWTRFVNRNVGRVDNADALVVMVNQMRKNFSMMSREEEIPAGGMALGYMSNLNIMLKRIKTEEDRITVRAEIKKNRQGVPARVAEYDIIYGKGIDHVGNILNAAVDFGIIDKSGSWYRFGDYRSQGLDNAARTFPIDDLREIVLHELKGAPVEDVVDDEE